MNALFLTYPFIRCEDLSLMRPALAMAGLALVLAALLWRRIRWRQASRAPDATQAHVDLHQLLQTRKTAAPARAQEAPALPLEPQERAAPPFEQARLDAMFGHDRRLQGEILALFVSETRDRLAGIAHALRCERAAPARILAQEILDGSHAMGLMPLQALARQAVHAGFSNDIAAQRRLHADLLMALDALSQAVTALQTSAAEADDRSDMGSLS
ncbi:hypothetical protein GQ37_013480 [Janthinobacterium sp. BJB1]|uniref:hypothetical protein n=1 Tax=Janthinobacterium sp. GW458P TaxID=1981504 RepID=UPI000A3263A8|nr:hypothetical protein [Janthinobacterium sp. GW458P]MBE3024480.1 hypothetical protein [Janthinobacterium sp. GW458P]PHV15244.1 hypothetical protein CSQ90_19710 [Janthinobacterium sp. BJB303]PJC98078.1 hypothetical protein GQ37_013480 [Janthinobacterium sp. BJB1]